MATPFLVAERTTRDFGRRLGAFPLDLATARQMAEVGQGLCVAGCAGDRIVRHACWAAHNLAPHQGIACFATYVLAEQARDRLLERGVAAYLFDRYERCESRAFDAPLIVTVPEKLYALREPVRGGNYAPEWLFLVDPSGMTVERIVVPGFEGTRARVCAQFRATCLAAGLQVPAVFWTGCAASAFGTENLCGQFGVEAMVYLDGRTIRTAGLAGEQVAGGPAAPSPSAVAQTEAPVAAETEPEAAPASYPGPASNAAAGPPSELPSLDARTPTVPAAATAPIVPVEPVTGWHPLDVHIAGGRRDGQRLVLVAGQNDFRNEMAVREYATLRGYPRVSLDVLEAELLRRGDHVNSRADLWRSLQDAVDARLRTINKRIVCITDFAPVAGRLGLHRWSALLNGNSLGVILFAAASGQFTAESLRSQLAGDGLGGTTVSGAGPLVVELE